MTGDLFHSTAEKDISSAPLAERLRPQSIDDMVGHTELLAKGSALRRRLERGDVPSMLLWGPPGSGKTTLARMLSRYVQAELATLSAVMDGIKEIRAAVEKAKERHAYHRRRTILFIDEIHRFNKSQQDALLPHVESGLFTLVGATTENPSFEVNSALLSRMQVFVLQPLANPDIQVLLQRAMKDRDRGLGNMALTLADDAAAALLSVAQGDARRALNTLELAAHCCVDAQSQTIEVAHVQAASQHKPLRYDKGGDEHYNVVSAFIKSMRGSDPDAAVYWMVRMLEAGEPPRFILRRMVIFASEDIGNADPKALQVAVHAMQAFELVGLPEGVLPLTQAATYLACAPKSNAVLKAYGAARRDVVDRGALPVPGKLKNAPTALMRRVGAGKGYKYPHNFDGNYVVEEYLPEELQGRHYYEPSDQGEEKTIQERLRSWRAAAE